MLRSGRVAARRTVIELIAVGLAARVCLIAGTLLGKGISVQHYLLSSDAPSYVAVARALLTGVRPESAWHERVFLGWPMLIALPGALIGHEAAALWLAVLLAALVPVIYFALTDDRPVSLLLAVLTPTWLMHSSLGMGEPAFLALQLLALLAWSRGRPLQGSAWASAAMVVRPTAFFVWLAIALADLRAHRRPRLTLLVAPAAATGLVLLCNAALYSDPARQLHAYSGIPNIKAEHLAALQQLPGPDGHHGLPLLHVLATPFVIEVATWKVAFIWAHLAAVIAACAIGIRRRERSELERAMLLWALCSTAFIVSTGPYWGFHTFDRYVVWALPAYAYLVRDRLPRSTWMIAALGAVSFALALWSRLR